MNGNEASPANVLGFWEEAGPDRWYKKDVEFDHEIASRFAELHRRAAAGELDSWAGSADGALALLLLLDQFSRNLFRGSPDSFAQDHKARAIATRAIEAGFDRQVGPAMRQFFYLPLMHSESIVDQERCVALCHSLPDPANLPFAREHEEIIRRFGRFPHRNEVLGRHTSPAEQRFLESGGFAG